jgi:predicted dehydrogenase
MELEMKILVVGLGSMGKRRVRNLQALGIQDLAGFDLRSDRREEVSSRHGIPVYEDLETAIDDFRPDAFVISTPPDVHMHYAFRAVERGIHCFMEASVVDADKIRVLAERVKDSRIVAVPSCTMRYFPGPQKIKELLRQGAIGKVLNVNYQTGQYLPDWHPWEDIKDFYVSKRETGGAREIVPFELTWLNNLFGKPRALACVKTKLTDMAADIDDIYHCLLDYDSGVLCNMTVEVISRPSATREMRILGTEGEIVYSADSNSVRYINTSKNAWEEFGFSKGTVEAQYINPEEPYIAEMRDFVSAVGAQDGSAFPNTLEDDFHVLETLNALEAVSVNL